MQYRTEHYSGLPHPGKSWIFLLSWKVLEFCLSPGKFFENIWEVSRASPDRIVKLLTWWVLKGY